MTIKNTNQYEEERLDELYSYNILDTLPDEEFDNLATLAAEIAGTSMSQINLIDKHRQWSKSMVGMEGTSKVLARDKSLCENTIKNTGVTEVRDLLADTRYADFDYVKDKYGLRYYLGIPLLSKEMYPIGTLCVLDFEKREVSEHQIRQLKIIAKQVMTHLELHKQNRELKSLNDYKVQLMKMLSHDMRSPLSGIIGLAGMLKEMHISDNEEHLEILNIIEQSSTQLNQMIDDVMSYTIIESDGLKLERKETDLEKTVNDISMLYKPASEIKKIHLNFYTENLEQPVFIDGNKFGQILGNLLSNAIKYTKTGGEVKLSLVRQASTNGDNLVLTVTDNGVGMKDSDVAGLLSGNAINTKDGGTSGEKSTGIGLAIVKHFVQLFSGEIDIESDPGEGSCFTVRIPL